MRSTFLLGGTYSAAHYIGCHQYLCAARKAIFSKAIITLVPAANYSAQRKLEMEAQIILQRHRFAADRIRFQYAAVLLSIVLRTIISAASNTAAQY